MRVDCRGGQYDCLALGRRLARVVRVLSTFREQGKAVRSGHSCAAVSQDRPPPRRRTTWAEPIDLHRSV